VPAMLMQSLRLASTLAGLVVASQRETEPVGTPAEAHLGPPAYGSLRYYRN